MPSLNRASKPQERLFLLREKERRGFHTPKIPAPPRGETGATNPHLKEGACAYGIGQACAQGRGSERIAAQGEAFRGVAAPCATH